MRVVLEHERAAILHGDAKDLAEILAENSVDAIVCDPPAAIAFMGKAWDDDRGGYDGWTRWLAGEMTPSFRALKPGGHALVWALPRTSHWTARALELAGFELRDLHHHFEDPTEQLLAFLTSLDEAQRAAFVRILESQNEPILYQIFGTGFPKSLNISKAIDDRRGAARAVTGRGNAACQYLDAGEPCRGHGGETSQSGPTIHTRPTGAATPEAAQWEGWGTALKPAAEHWILCRKSLDGTVAGNVLAHGTGGLNIEACRIGYAAGRWPAHVSLDEAAAAILDEQSGETGSGGRRGLAGVKLGYKGDAQGYDAREVPRSKGGASRFFYVAKGARSEKDAGLEHLEPRTGGEATDREDGSAGLGNPRAGAGRTGGARNFHPTVKSLALMRWLVRLITPPGGTVLDPFAGSGSTGVAALAEGFSFVGCEQGGENGEYIPILEGRIRHALTSCVTSDPERSAELRSEA